MNDLYLNAEQYKNALERFRQGIINGRKLEYFDCTDIGNKDTQCSWGLCSSDPEHWPDPQDHLFPERSSPKYRAKGQHCPLDKRAHLDSAEQMDAFGCFYHCRIFQASKARHPTRERTIELYDISIKRLNYDSLSKDS